MFRASWTGWRWIPWQGSFKTANEAFAAIHHRNLYDRSAERIVAKAVFDGRAWQEIKL